MPAAAQSKRLPMLAATTVCMWARDERRSGGVTGHAVLARLPLPSPAIPSVWGKR